MNYNDKNIIRKEMIKKREALSVDEHTYLSRLIFEKLASLPEYKNSRFIMTYISFRNEVDTKNIIKDAFFNNKRVAVPITMGGKIISSEIFSNSVFKIGTFGVSEPKEIFEVDPKILDLIIVPGNTFDKHGNRLGYGKGYYDRFLPKTKAVKIGLCYDFNLVDEIPVSDNDIPMDIIITDKSILRFEVD